MNVFNHLEFSGHEKVLFCHDQASGLSAIIAIHNTRLGSALGGCRMLPYRNMNAALTDVLRLSRGMTYKSAIARLPFGGGKAVIIGDPQKAKTRELLRAMGRCVDSLGGLYVTAEDMHITNDDCGVMAEVTPHVDWVIPGFHGNSSAMTAYGVEQGILAAIRFMHRSQNATLAGHSCLIQGIGKVGFPLAHSLKQQGMKVYVTSTNKETAERARNELGVEVVSLQKMLNVPVDVYAPCATGAVINDRTVNRINASVVCGSANNILLRPEHGEMLRQRGILLVPDYVANCGGVIDAFYYLQSANTYSREKVEEHVRSIAYTLAMEIFSRSILEGRATNTIADEIAESYVHS